MSWPAIAYIGSVLIMAAALAVIIGEPLARRGQIWAVLMGYQGKKGKENGKI